VNRPMTAEEITDTRFMPTDASGDNGQKSACLRDAPQP
jgi:hypothetical protein